MKKTLALIFAILVIVTCFAACGNTQNDSNALRIPEESLEGVEHESFSKFTAIDLDGNKVTEDIFKGKKVTMINIWATFCHPCISEMPALTTLHQEYANKGFQVIGLISDVSYLNDGYEPTLYQRALDIVEATEVTYRNLLPSKSLDFIKLSEVYSVPETIFVDENGNIIGESYIGSRSYESWKVLIDSVFDSIAE